MASTPSEAAERILPAHADVLETVDKQRQRFGLPPLQEVPVDEIQALLKPEAEAPEPVAPPEPVAQPTAAPTPGATGTPKARSSPAVTKEGA